MTFNSLNGLTGSCQTHPDGLEGNHRLMAENLHDSGSNVVEVLGISADLTDRYWSMMVNEERLSTKHLTIIPIVY